MHVAACQHTRVAVYYSIICTWNTLGYHRNIQMLTEAASGMQAGQRPFRAPWRSCKGLLLVKKTS